LQRKDILISTIDVCFKNMNILNDREMAIKDFKITSFHFLFSINTIKAKNKRKIFELEKSI